MLNTACVFLHRYQISSVTMNDAQGRVALNLSKHPGPSFLDVLTTFSQSVRQYARKVRLYTTGLDFGM